MELTGKKALVTGGAGFIGSHLVDALLREGCSVRALDNLENGRLENVAHHRENPAFTFMQGDITDPFDAFNAAEGIDVVFHLACLGVRHSLRHPFENHRANAEGSLLMLEAARRAKCRRFIYCSSSEIYGTAEHVPMTEDHPTRPCTVYGASKLAGEAYTRGYYQTYGLPALVIRPFNTFGPRSHHEGDSGEVIPKAIVRALNNAPLLMFGDGLQTRDFTYVEDTAAGLVAAAKCDAIIGKTLNIGSNFEISVRDLLNRLKGMMKDSASPLQHIQNRPGDVLRLYADSSRFMAVTGWKPRVSFDEGLKRTIEWFRSRPQGPAALLAEEVAVCWE